jgi:hypothetical protein
MRWGGGEGISLAKTHVASSRGQRSTTAVAGWPLLSVKGFLRGHGCPLDGIKGIGQGSPWTARVHLQAYLEMHGVVCMASAYLPVNLYPNSQENIYRAYYIDASSCLIPVPRTYAIKP